MTAPHVNIIWRTPDARIEVAAALGAIAADLWLAGKVRLTSGHSVATLAVDEEAGASRQDRDGQASGDGGGREAVA